MSGWVIEEKKPEDYTGARGVVRGERKPEDYMDIILRREGDGMRMRCSDHPILKGVLNIELFGGEVSIEEVMDVIERYSLDGEHLVYSIRDGPKWGQLY